MKNWLAQNWRPLSGTILLVAIYFVSKHPALAQEKALLEAFGVLWGVVGINAIPSVKRAESDE